MLTSMGSGRARRSPGYLPSGRRPRHQGRDGHDVHRGAATYPVEDGRAAGTRAGRWPQPRPPARPPGGHPGSPPGHHRGQPGSLARAHSLLCVIEGCATSSTTGWPRWSAAAAAAALPHKMVSITVSRCQPAAPAWRARRAAPGRAALPAAAAGALAVGRPARWPPCRPAVRLARKRSLSCPPGPFAERQRTATPPARAVRSSHGRRAGSPPAAGPRGRPRRAAQPSRRKRTPAPLSRSLATVSRTAAATSCGALQQHRTTTSTSPERASSSIVAR